MYPNSVNISILAGAAVRKGQVVKISSGKVIPCSAQGETFFGVALADAALNERVTVCVQGACDVEVNDATVVVGSYLTTSAAGVAETAASGDYVLGMALEKGSAGVSSTYEYIRVALRVFAGVVPA